MSLAKDKNLNQNKKRYSVDVTCATVCFFVRDQRVGFLDSKGIIFWINLAEDKTFSKMNFSEGKPFWIYVVRELGRILATAPHQGEKAEEMPAMEPAEL